MTERHLNYTKHILKNQGHYKTKFCNALDFLSCLKAVQTSKLKFQIINYLTLGYKDLFSRDPCVNQMTNESK